MKLINYSGRLMPWLASDFENVYLPLFSLHGCKC